MRLIAALLLLPSISFAGWTVEPTWDTEGALGFQAFEDGQLSYEVDPEHFAPGFFKGFRADFISDDGYVAGTAFQMSHGRQWGDGIVFTVGPQSGLWEIDAGNPMWMDSDEWVCVGSSSYYLVNARTHDRSEGCGEVEQAPEMTTQIPEPATLALLLGAGLLTVRRRY